MNSRVDWIAGGYKLFKFCRTVPRRWRGGGELSVLPVVCRSGLPLICWRVICHFGYRKTEATARSKTDVKQRGCRALLFITGQWSTLIDSPVTFLFINPAPTTTQPLTGWSIASRQTKHGVVLLRQICNIRHGNRRLSLFTCINCVLQENSFCACGLLKLLEAVLHCPNFISLCIFSFVRASRVILNVKTSSRHSGLLGFKRNPAGVLRNWELRRLTLGLMQRILWTETNQRELHALH